MNTQTINEIPITSKSNESKDEWQKDLTELKLNSLITKRGLIALQSPTGSGKSRAVKLMLEKNNINNALIIKKGAKHDKTIARQWKSKENLDAISLHLDGMGFTKFKEQLQMNGIDYDSLECIVLDEAHENYAFLFYGHGCHIRHQGKDHIGKFNKRYEESPIQPIVDVCTEKLLFLVSDTLDSIICEELPMYAGLFPIDRVVVKPTGSYYKDIPTITYIEDNEDIQIRKIIEIYKKLKGDKKSNWDKCIIYVDKVAKSKSLKEKLISAGIHSNKITEYNNSEGIPTTLDLYPITIFVDKGSSGIDDPHVKYIFSLRNEKSTVDSNLDPTRLNIAYDLRQRIGRIRGLGGVVFLIRDDITREKYIESIKSCYNRSTDKLTNNVYILYETMYNYLGTRNMDALESQRIPGLVTNMIKHRKDDRCSGQDTVIQSFKDYLIKHHTFFDIIRERLIDGDFRVITTEISLEFVKHMKHLVIEFKKHLNIEDSKLPTKHIYSNQYIENHRIRCISNKTVLREELQEDKSELKQSLYNGICEIIGEERDIDDLDLARVKEGKDGGEYTRGNSILCTPDIHRWWDSGKLIIFRGIDQIEFRVSKKEYEKRVYIKKMFERIPEIVKVFERIEVCNLTYRNTHELSHQ
jgi:hypothetical protein